MHAFITGTGTGVGKTHVTTLMLRALRDAGRTVCGFKPISCGGREDAQAILEASSPGFSLDEINPVALKTPAAPHVACQFDGRSIDRNSLIEGFHSLAGRADHVLVEGAGGWAVPVAPGLTMADLAADLRLPVIVVVDNRLGALNHTILTVEAIQGKGLQCAGLILNHLADERDMASITNRQTLEEWLGIPVLEDVLHAEDHLDPQWVLEALAPATGKNLQSALAASPPCGNR